MNTVTHENPEEYDNGSRWTSVASVIPATTPRVELRILQDRYQADNDATIRILPPMYRTRVLARIDDLLMHATPDESDS